MCETAITVMADECPLCGVEPRIRKSPECIRFECSHCGMTSGFRPTVEQATDAWNSKVIEAQGRLFNTAYA